MYYTLIFALWDLKISLFYALGANMAEHSSRKGDYGAMMQCLFNYYFLRAEPKIKINTSMVACV